MDMSNTIVKVAALPNCDFCGAAAHYDGKTKIGPWANMCENCFKKLGVGLGLGKGQKLVALVSATKTCEECGACDGEPEMVDKCKRGVDLW